jgi:mono/diheme cytochrome c family protein
MRTRVSTTLILTLSCLFMASARSAAQAEDLYKANCSSCHAMDGSGATAAGKKMGLVDLRSQQVQNLSDDELFKTIAYGVKHKQYPHAFMSRGVTQDQINQLVGYLRKLPKSK